MSIIAGEESARLEIGGEGEDRPLTDQERALLTRLLSDPFAYPIQFKTWLVSFLEGSDLLLPRSSVQGLSSLLGGGGGKGVLGLLPAGLIFPYGGAEAPAGAFLCNGAAYSTTGFKRLFDAIGFTYGGSGALFNVPDLRRRLPLGAGAGAGYAPGNHDGQVEGNRSLSHQHYFADSPTVAGSTGWEGDHAHNVYVTQARAFTMLEGQQSQQTIAKAEGAWLGTEAGGGHDHWFEQGITVSGWTSGGFLQDKPAYQVVSYIINQ